MARVVFLLGMYAACFATLRSAVAEPIVPDANTIVLDHFDGSTTGAAYGSVTYGPSVPGYGQAAGFGPGNFIRYPFASLPQGTIEMWLKPDAASTDYALMTMNTVLTDSFPPAGYYMHVGLTATDRRGRISAWPSGLTEGVSSVPLDDWTHLAMTWDGSSSQIYLNGAADGPAGGGISPGNGYFYLNYWGNTGFVGMIDELHISNTVRSAAEIASHATRASAVPEIDAAGMGSALALVAGALGLLDRRRRKAA